MKFSEELKREREKKISEHAVKFSEEIKGKLLQAGAEGYEGYVLKLEGRNDAHILEDEHFHTLLEKILEGCQVGIQTTESMNIIGTIRIEKKLYIKWS